MEYAKQSEILFLWDGENWNPNGDMLNSNAPRYDEISRKALVSDVRIKRTIRDFLESEGEEIFVKETYTDKGLADGKARVKSIAGENKDVEEAILQKCIDVRAFGGVFPVEGQTHNLTGPMQFKMSKSLNETEIVFIKGTGAFASKEGQQNKTFREEYILPYAIFATYGVINALNSQKTKLTEEDVQKILHALWSGTKNLISRSKFGQLPRFLMRILYKEPGVYIGGLDNLIRLSTPKASQLEIRSIEDFALDIEKIVQEIEKYNDKIEKIEYQCDDSLNIAPIPKSWERVEFGV